MTSSDWLLVAIAYGAIATLLGLVVLGSLLERTRDEVRTLTRALEARKPHRPERREFDADRIHRIGGGS